MTLIVAKVRPDSAEVLADSLACTVGLVDLFTSTKGRMLPHLNAAMYVNGPTWVDTVWGSFINQHRGPGWDFDKLDAFAQEQLPHVWEDLPAEYRDDADDDPSNAYWRGRAGAGVQVLHVGWSPARERFVGYVYASADGFASQEITDQPYWASARPRGVVDPAHQLDEDADWLDLTVSLFSEWALADRDDEVGVLHFGGDLVQTTLYRNVSSQRVIGTIPLDGHPFRRSLIGSAHWTSQLGPCRCGSNRPYVLCHPGAFDPEKPCICGSGARYRHCHLVDPRSEQAAEFWRAHAVEDFGADLDLDAVRIAAEQMDEYWRNKHTRPTLRLCTDDDDQTPGAPGELVGTQDTVG